MRALLFFFFFLFWLPVGASAQALLAGSEYYDSFETLASVVIMKAAGNQAGRDWLEKEGRILPKADQSLPVIIIARGAEPQSGCEFRFPAFPHTYWTFSENVATLEELKSGEASSSPESSPTPVAEPPPLNPSATPVPENLQPTPSPTIALASPSPTPTSPTAPKKKKHSHQSGAIQWHQINGQWKWQPLDRSQFKGWEAGARAPDGSRGP